MRTVIHSAHIVTVDDTDTVHYDSAIAIDGKRIAAIGSNDEILARIPDAERIDGSGKAVLPGFANSHTHFTMTLTRGIFVDQSPPHRPPFPGGLRSEERAVGKECVSTCRSGESPDKEHKKNP